MRLIICLSLSLLIISTISAQVNIIPRPAEVKLTRGNFFLSPSTVIVVRNGVDDNAADFFNDYLKQYTGFSLKKTKTAKSNYIELTTLQTLVPGKEGAYSLTVTSKNIAISGQTASGTFYGMQTLIQLLPVPIPNSRIQIPFVTIKDYPRFAYRGMHLDVGRHFFPVSFVKKYIDYIALHKMNYFHWHLTEDQGWRIEIKKYPKLTSEGAWRNGTIIGRYPGKGNDNTRYGGYYTQEEVKEVVRYAKERYVEVIPEIEMPGHGSAAIAAYSWLSCFPAEPTAIPANMISKKSVDEQANGKIKLVQETWGVFDDVFCAGKDSTFLFLQDVIDEVITLFPSRYFHVGGDECPKTHWKKCPFCQQRMKDNGLKDEHELQSYFIQRIEKYLNSKGKTLIGWDEILEGGLAPKAVVMSWRGEAGGIAAARQNHDVVMTPGAWVYFDHSQSLNEDSITIGGYTPVEKTYSYKPVPDSLNAEQAKHILGAQGNVWTEYMANTRKVEYMIFPRMSALSEVLWSQDEKRDYKDFEKRLQMQFKRYDLWKANYSKAYFDLKATVLPTEDYNGVLWKLESINKNGKIEWVPSFTSSLLSDYDKPLIIKKDADRMSARYVVDGNTVSTIFQSFHFNKATGKKITLTNEPSKNYPGDGAFTLVNGVQNEKGLARSKEVLGFEGTDCEAIIDLGTNQTISNAVIHALNSGGSRVYPPKYAEVFISADGNSFTSIGKGENFENTVGTNGIIKVSFPPVSTRYVKVLVKNLGSIPAGRPGVGEKPLMLVDEIEVN
jgi:hexosaminidase